jgi:type 1 glutamine amidotransferase
MKRVLLVLSGLIHPPYRGRLWLKEALAELAGYSFDEVSSLAEAVQRPLSDYDAMVLYYHHRDVPLTDAELTSFRSFVSNGGGVLAVHSATASYKPTRGYFEVLGGRFTGHGPVQSIEVRPVRGASPIFEGIPAFTVHDELYVHELQPDLDVHFVAEHQGKAEPMVWTRAYGSGRVCYACPGHRAASMQHESVREILRRGLTWVVHASQ